MQLTVRLQVIRDRSRRFGSCDFAVDSVALLTLSDTAHSTVFDIVALPVGSSSNRSWTQSLHEEVP